VVVQAPHDAEAPSMPRAAIATANPDHIVPLVRMGEIISGLTGTQAPRQSCPEDLTLEVGAAVRLGEASTAINDRLGRAAPHICPDCGGPLWHLSEGRLSRFRCQLGHVMNDDVLAAAKASASTQALWIAARTLDERARLLGDMARSQRSVDRGLSAHAYERRAAEVRGAADEIRRMLATAPPDEGEEP
jgi:two-component system chemotaxis response regulator CheB